MSRPKECGAIAKYIPLGHCEMMTVLGRVVMLAAFFDSALTTVGGPAGARVVGAPAVVVELTDAAGVGPGVNGRSCR